MNSSQAKTLSLPDIMRRLGYEPSKVTKGGKELWYKSPFRDENEASFHTSFLGGKWIWNDFGDIGGTVIDFIMRHENFSSPKDALSFLRQMYQGDLFEDRPKSQSRRTNTQQNQPSLFSFQQQSGAAARNFFENKDSLDPYLEFIKAQPIKNLLIHKYLYEARCIPRVLADVYLKEIHYRNTRNGKDYFAFGMQNDSGGYEIRVASDQYSFKSALINRDITLIQGEQSRGEVAVFEGMLDALSWLVYLRSKVPPVDTMILHSTSTYGRALEKIRLSGYKRIHTFLDNNPSGRACTVKFEEAFPGQVSDHSALFSPYVDVNEALKQGHNSGFSSLIDSSPQP